ncbi:hypothetical protein COB21_01850 [Candidatus Aerophobetes bacterium]|uniref:Uncharacterized protein n=1 Tax=Aerophobetes bacterium TaxID=2030807 RepID=A0A2A4X5Z3_UNCAE|nr:MAG: hypothetical protein COB21_01850 [Candidatus Aerophobetes bacterium]
MLETKPFYKVTLIFKKENYFYKKYGIKYMSDMNVPSSGNTPEYRKQEYYDRYKETLDCFHKSFTDYQDKKGNSNELQKVMDDCLGLLNQIAKESLSKKQQGTNQKLHSDYESYIHAPSKEKAQNIEKDVSELS